MAVGYVLKSRLKYMNVQDVFLLWINPILEKKQSRPDGSIPDTFGPGPQNPNLTKNQTSLFLLLLHYPSCCTSTFAILDIRSLATIGATMTTGSPCSIKMSK
jgi:hypothetical protein